MPETTCAATRVGRVSPGISREKMTNEAAPYATNIGSKTCQAVAPLPLEADGSAKHNRSAQIEEGVQEADRSHPWLLLRRRKLVPRARKNAHLCSVDDICMASCK